MKRTDREGIEAIARQFYSTLYSAKRKDAKHRKYLEINWELKIVEEQQQKDEMPPLP